MQTIVYGNSITFQKIFIDSNGSYIDPVEIEFSIVKDINTILYGPFSYDSSSTPATISGNFERLGQGIYQYTQYIEDIIVPGIYSAKWSTTIEEATAVSYENFQVIEPEIVTNRIIDPSSLYGKIVEKPLYSDLGVGKTDRLALIGHADGLELNTPHRVIDIQETINILGADANSPLLRGMFEAYNMGAKDIWLIASAPMSEYVQYDEISDISRKTQRADLDNLNFYQKYSQRLDVTYRMLMEEDFPEIVVPLEAPFFDAGDVDFLTPLLSNCLQRYRRTGNISIGIIGTRIPANTENIFNKLNTDTRISRLEGSSYIYSTKTLYSILKYHYGINLFSGNTQSNILDGQDMGKFGMVVIGEGLSNAPQLGYPYTASLAATVAGLMASMPENQSLVNKKLSRISGLVGYKFSQDEIQTLARKRLNVATLTPLGRRGTSYQVFVSTDNSLANGWPDTNADDQSAFWSVATLRLVGKISQNIVSLGRRSLGTIQYAMFKDSVYNYLDKIKAKGLLKDYRLKIYRGNDANRTVYVDLMLYPYFTIREIYFTVEVGPGTGE